MRSFDERAIDVDSREDEARPIPKRMARQVDRPLNCKVERAHARHVLGVKSLLLEPWQSDSALDILVGVLSVWSLIDRGRRQHADLSIIISHSSAKRADFRQFRWLRIRGRPVDTVVGVWISSA